MHGFYIGDIVANSYTHENAKFNLKTKNFKFFTPRSKFSDDTILTFATMYWCLYSNHSSKDMLQIIKKFYKIFPDTTPTIYGSSFAEWEAAGFKNFRQSCGNGGAMRCAPIAWYSQTYDQIDIFIEAAISPTHNTPIAKHAAKIICYAIFYLRHTKNKHKLKQFLKNTFGIRFPDNFENYRASYSYTSDAMETILPALLSFFHAKSFIDCLRTAISFGGDSDTITCIAASLAEVYYPIPSNLQKICMCFLPQKLQVLLYEFNQTRNNID